tara:strand:- start:1535 stop:2209 length:675 start_codon:yes stop_codon:yes gene_type:complete
MSIFQGGNTNIWGGRSKVTTYVNNAVATSGNAVTGNHTTQSWCKAVVAALVGGGGGGGIGFRAYGDGEDNSPTTGYGGAGGSGGTKFYVNTNNTAAITIAYSVGRGGAILGGHDCDDPSGIADGGRGAHGGNTTFGGVTAGYGGGGQGAGYSGAAAGGAGGSGDLVGETGPTGIFNRITSGSFWGKYGKGGAGSVGGHSGDRNGCNGGNQQGGIGGAIIILELG